MAKKHTVLEGEHISSIAALHGFGNWRTIWDHPDNAGLKKERADPHILTPGDVITIPDLEVKTRPAAAERVNDFTLAESPLFLRVRLQDVDAKALQKTPCTVGLETPGQTEPAETDAKGLLEQEIGRLVKNGEVTALPKDRASLKYDLKIGLLRDQSTLEGQQARLNNLGYFAGFAKGDLEQFRWAVEEFECDLARQRITVAPRIDPEKGVLDKKGKPDTVFIGKLVKEHGV